MNHTTNFFRLMNSPTMDLWLQHGVLFEGDEGMNKAVTTLWLEGETLVEVKLTKGFKRAHVRYDDLKFDLPFMVFIGLAADRDWGFVGVL